MKKGKLALLLAVVLVMANFVYAANMTDGEVTFSQKTEIKWMFDQEQFESVFVTYTPSDVVQKITHHIESVNQTNMEEQGILASYTFDVDGDGEIAPIKVEGVLTAKRYAAFLTVYEGVLYGNAHISGVSYQVNAVVQEKITEKQVYSGITMIPETAQSLDDYIFFSIGDPIVTTEMLTQWRRDCMAEGEQQDFLEERITQMRSSGDYRLVAQWSQSFPNGDAGSYIQYFHNNDTINRSCISVATNTDLVTEHYSATGQAETYVKTVQIGLRANEGDAAQIPRIDNIHHIPIDSEDESDFIDTSFISFALRSMSDFFNIPGSVFAPLEMILNGMSTPGAVEVSSFQTGTNANVEFTFNTQYLNGQPVRFDDTPLPVTFNLDTAVSTYGRFCAYSHVEYYTTYIPYGIGTSPVFLSTDGGTAVTAPCILWVD